MSKELSVLIVEVLASTFPLIYKRRIQLHNFSLIVRTGCIQTNIERAHLTSHYMGI